jgi:hypothetical protein
MVVTLSDLSILSIISGYTYPFSSIHHRTPLCTQRHVLVYLNNVFYHGFGFKLLIHPCCVHVVHIK